MKLQVQDSRENWQRVVALATWLLDHEDDVDQISLRNGSRTALQRLLETWGTVSRRRGKRLSFKLAKDTWVWIALAFYELIEETRGADLPNWPPEKADYPLDIAVWLAHLLQDVWPHRLGLKEVNLTPWVEEWGARNPSAPRSW